ncbi:MAG: FG-GAP repeat protein [Chitinophagaceae bacterium]|nr:FG-GAP repeat protein [Chitinophagaceae bacterium]
MVYFGYSVACAGDVNGDGFSDLIIGAYNYDDGANTDEGMVLFIMDQQSGYRQPDSTPDDANKVEQILDGVLLVLEM